MNNFCKKAYLQWNPENAITSGLKNVLKKQKHCQVSILSKGTNMDSTDFHVTLEQHLYLFQF